MHSLAGGQARHFGVDDGVNATENFSHSAYGFERGWLVVNDGFDLGRAAELRVSNADVVDVLKKATDAGFYRIQKSDVRTQPGEVSNEILSEVVEVTKDKNLFVLQTERKIFHFRIEKIAQGGRR